MSHIYNFFYRQFFTKLSYPTRSHSGQTIIVTGSNVGLGLEAARHFARLDADKVILAVRDLDKGEAAKKSIEDTTNRKGVVETWQLDLASNESIKEFVKRAEDLKRLDAVIENAGLLTMDYAETEGNETTIAVNVVGTFLLALMILPKLRETAKHFNVAPHLSIVTSEVYAWTSFPERNSPSIFESLNDKRTARMADRYNVSKLLEIYYGRELAQRTKKSGHSDVIINMMNPGFCHSELAREVRTVVAVVKFFLARTTEHGGRALVHASQAGVETHGQYLSNCQVTEPAPWITDAEGAKTQTRVWDELSQKLEAIQPGIMSNV